MGLEKGRGKHRFWQEPRWRGGVRWTPASAECIDAKAKRAFPRASFFLKNIRGFQLLAPLIRSKVGQSPVANTSGKQNLENLQIVHFFRHSGMNGGACPPLPLRHTVRRAPHRTHRAMASLTMTRVLCRAPVVGGRVTRVSPAAARGTASSSTKTGQPSSVSLPGSVRLFGPRPESRSVRQRTALNAITDTTEPVAGVEEKPEPELKSDVRRTRCPTGFAPGPPVRTRFSSSHFSASVPTLARSNGVSRRARRRVLQTSRPLRVNHVTRVYGKRTHWMRLRATPPSSTPAEFPHPTETLTDLPKYPLLISKNENHLDPNRIKKSTGRRRLRSFPRPSESRGVALGG